VYAKSTPRSYATLARVIGVVGGVVAALLWGVSGVVAGRSSRILGAEQALAWVYVVGVAVALPAAAVTGAPGSSARGAAWAAAAAPAAVVSLYLMYAALRRGPVVLILPVTASQGAIAALVAVGFGEHLQVAAAVGLLVVTVGMYAVVRRPTERSERADHPTVAIALAAVCAVVSGFALYASARAGAGIGSMWSVAALRVAGIAGVTLPVALRGGLRSPLPALRFVVFNGLADTGAFACYVVATQHGGVAVPAVISSQFAIVSVLLGVVAMGERLSRLQLGGVVSILAGVALVTAVQS
jgi:drug/metabolite transporter (DMT)-like permease